MKALSVTIFSVGLLMASSASFAEHAIRTQECKSNTHEIEYNGSYAVGGDYSISRAGAEFQFMALPSESEGVKTSLEDAEVIFEEASSIVAGKTQIVKDCGYDYSFWKTHKVLSIKEISKNASKQLGLWKGSKLRLNCEESLMVPNGKACE